MSGSIPILIAKGAQDAYITDNPKITFFRETYQRHTNFAQDVQTQIIEGNPGNAGISTVTIQKKGDMLSYMYLTKRTNGVLQPDINSDDIDKIELFIGEQMVDRITTDQLVSMRNMNSKYTKTHRGSEKNGKLGFHGKYHYPLGFFFCEEWCMALPLVSLQYHAVTIRITWGATPAASGTTYEMWANYIYLDESDRTRLSADNNKVTMLIAQHQEIEDTNTTDVDLVFNNPVSFIFGKSGSVDIFGDNPRNVSAKLRLQINGTDVVDNKEVIPHYSIIPTIYHTEFGSWDSHDPLLNVVVSTQPTWPYTTLDIQRDIGANINFMYPFCLNTSGKGGQTSGTCNFSRIDTAKLVATKKITSPIYARSYNILQISSGMGGILFGN